MLSYLALGDSYTIGEQVLLKDSFPYQTAQILRKVGIAVAAPEIVAITGYTTDELLQLMQQTKLLPKYDLVSLLIGVNNQYRGRSVDDFANEFEDLLQRAIALAGGKPQQVFVLSIPDWGVTPFAAERNVAEIAAGIDAYNAVCRTKALELQCGFIDITTSQRKDGANANYLAPDQLHPSGLEYAKWAEQLSAAILAML